MEPMNGDGQLRDAEGMEIRDLVDRLIAILDGHIRIHRRLLDVLEAKKSAMVEARIEDLEKIVDVEREAIAAVTESERERIRTTDAIGEAMGFSPARRMRLLDLVQVAPEDQKEVLLDLRDDLREIADAIDRLNRLNRTLVLHSLEHVHLFLTMLGGADPDAKLYTAAGGAGAKAGSLLVDRRI